MSRALYLVGAVAVAALAGSCTVVQSDGAKPKPVENTTPEGLPCAVSDVLAASCTSCHSDPPTAGAPTALLTYSNLTAPSKADPSITMAEESLVRMQNVASPMPPDGSAAADQIAAFQQWVDAGLPQGSCDTLNSPDPTFLGQSVCSTATKWTSGNQGSSRMNPGMACNKCHKATNVFTYDAAGTIYATGHEPDRCNGLNGKTSTDVIIRVNGSDGKSYDAHPNAAGNFYFFNVGLKKPYTAKVISSKGERVMSQEQTNGDCNLCHTEQAGGNNTASPGRIAIPY